MKRAERHRLKENEVSETLRQALERFAQYGRGMAAGVIVVVAVLAVAGGYWGWRSRTDARARELLSAALTIAEAPVSPPPAATPADAKAGTPPAPQAGSYPSARARSEALLPRVTEVADNYPSTDAGLAARYYAASTLAALGRSAEAAARFQEVIDRGGAESFYGHMAQLGIIDAQIEAGQYDRAIAACQALVNRKDESLPVDAVLDQLGRAYVAAAKVPEATQTFNRLVKEFPASPYVAEAKRALDSLSSPR
jgi:TolA-binding protein